MNTALVERYNRPSQEVIDKLEQSRAGAEQLARREIKCPSCGFYLLDVYGRDHHYTRVKCRKCKFNEVIDTALFRTVKQSRYNRYNSFRRNRAIR